MDPPNIVILDGYTTNPGDLTWQPIESLGRVTIYDRTPEDQIIERASDADVVLTNKTPLNASTLQQLPRLKMIGVLATGYNVIDLEAARTAEITVCNVPAYSTDSVAQHVFALLLHQIQAVELHDQAVHDGQWSNCDDFMFTLRAPMELAGLNMGIVGYGRIGRKVADIAHALGMNLMVHSRTRKDPPDWPNFQWVELDELFTQCDVITLHCPLTDQTRHLVDRERLAQMKSTAYLVNTGRGPLVDEAALAEALHEQQLAGAMVDVMDQEPPAADSPLLSAPRCTITPHIAWASVAARKRLIQITANNIDAWRQGQPIHVVSG